MRVLLYLAIGLTIGGVSGALGIGGGVLLVPALMWLCGLDPRSAAGTTLAVLAMPVVLPAVIKYHSARLLDLQAAAWIAAAFALGAYGGAYLVVHQVIPQSLLRLIFGLGMMYVAMRFILASNSEAAIAAAGLVAALLGWLTFLGLRLLGRRHLTPPRLGETIRLAQQQRGDPDYSI
jgi:hypothetical protein